MNTIMQNKILKLKIGLNVLYALQSQGLHGGTKYQKVRTKKHFSILALCTPTLWGMDGQLDEQKLSGVWTVLHTLFQWPWHYFVLPFGTIKKLNIIYTSKHT